MLVCLSYSLGLRTMEIISAKSIKLFVRDMLNKLARNFPALRPMFLRRNLQADKVAHTQCLDRASFTELWSRHFCEQGHDLCEGTSKDKVLLQLMPIAEDGKVSCKVALFSWYQTCQPLLKKAKYQL